MQVRFRLKALLLAGLACGCAGTRDAVGDAERPKTLLSWSAGKEPDDKKKDDEKDEGRGTGDDAKVERPPAAADKDEPLASDRPDFTEASSTVGKGRIQLESGYTFVRDRADGATTNSHSYPEALLRIGMLAEWFELRVGQNFGTTRSGAIPDGFRGSGAEDLYLGVKLGLTEQNGVLPETALILQTTVPTGRREFSGGRTLPGLNFLYGWDVIEDRLTLAGSSQANRATDDVGHPYVELAQSVTIGYGLTKKLGAYTEWFAFYPSGAIAPGTTPQHYFNGGFTYRVTPNFQLDIRAGVGLNRRADDFFAGTGFAYRY